MKTIRNSIIGINVRKAFDKGHVRHCYKHLLGKLTPQARGFSQKQKCYNNQLNENSRYQLRFGLVINGLIHHNVANHGSNFSLESYLYLSTLQYSNMITSDRGILVGQKKKEL